MDRGIFVPRKEAENTTLAEALDRYEQEISSKKKSNEYEKVYIRQWKSTPLAKRFLASIQGKDIAAYRDARLKDVGPNAVRHELALLSHLFTISIKEWGLAGLVNPVMQIRKPKPPPGRDRRLRKEEETVLLSSCEKYNTELSSIVRLALETAMRRSEITSMTWEKVNLKKRTVTLPETKNGEKRIVPLSPEAPEAVRILERIPRRIDGEVWGLESDSITQAFIRALFRTRSIYEKECQEKGEEKELRQKIAF